jgi:sterol desaturase/sphingolipid hydroxylase (fatty acid hydroxylase superfamily)
MKAEELERRLRAIEERNRRVEADKAWETSRTRKAIISLFTYAAIALYLYAIEVPMPFLNAIVPTVGFLLSTLTLPFFKKLWIERAHSR